MHKLKSFFIKNRVLCHSVSCVALAFATIAANSRCAYIFHNPEKPEALQKLKKF